MTEMEMRVAKAICCPSGVCKGGAVYAPINGSVSICQAFSFDEEARAAIAAMREPTPDMRIAGGIAWCGALPAAETYVDSADAGWKAMIDSALK